MLRHLRNALGLHTKAELIDYGRFAADHHRQIADAAMQIASQELGRAVIYAAALAHSPVDEPHLTDLAGTVAVDAEHWLNVTVGLGSGQLLPDAEELLRELERGDVPEIDCIDDDALARILDAIRGVHDEDCDQDCGYGCRACTDVSARV